MLIIDFNIHQAGWRRLLIRLATQRCPRVEFATKEEGVIAVSESYFRLASRITNYMHAQKAGETRSYADWFLDQPPEGPLASIPSDDGLFS